MTGVAAWGRFFDRVVAFPIRVAECNSAILTFETATDAARAFVPGEDFQLVETRPGVASMVVTVMDYLRPGWMACHEITFGFLARPAGSPQTGIYMYRMSVDEALSCAVGRGTMDYPVSIELIEMVYAPDEAIFKLAVGVHPTLELRIPRMRPQRPVKRSEMPAFSHRDGIPYIMPVELDVPPARIADPRTVKVVLGSGPVAEELRRLGLASPPASCTWGERLSATYHEGRPLSVGTPLVAD